MDVNQRTSEQAGSANGHPAAEAAVPKKYGKIDVNAMLFKAARECQSSEETRYYLGGVYVQPHPERGALLVATDGHRLIAIHDETGICEKPAIVRTIVRMRKQDPNDRAEAETILETYLQALGMI